MVIVRDVEYIVSDVYPDIDKECELTYVLSDYYENKECVVWTSAVYEELSVDAACQTMDMR